MTRRQRLWIFIGIIFYFLILIILGIFVPKTLLANPLITPENFLLKKPFTLLFGTWTLIVPSSTLIVYLLGIQILYLGLYLRKNGKSTWGASLIFWGIGTILAGTSYQGFGYELKCEGYEYCLFTSWFELAYLFTTAISISLMGFAFAKQFASGNGKKYLKIYSESALFIYTLLLIYGSITENQFLISYELFSLFFMPLFIMFFIFNVLNYKKNKNRLDKSFIILWLLFLFVNIAYYAYYIPNIAQTLYTNTNIWFSANDVLHLGLIGWFLYFQFKITKKLN